MTQTTKPATTGRTALGGRWWLAYLGVVALAALAVAMVVGGGAEFDDDSGITGPGALVSWGYPVLRLLATMAAVAVVGLLLYAAGVGPQGRDGVLSKVGRRDVIHASRAAWIWAVTSLLAAAFALAWALGVPLSQALTPEIISTYGGDLAIVRALAITGLAAAAMGIALMFVATVSGAGLWLIAALVLVALPALTGHAAGLGDHGLALTADITHAVAMTVWVGGLIVLAHHAWRNDPGLPQSVASFRIVASWAFGLLVASGLMASYSRMTSITDLWTTGFGRLVLAKVCLMLALLWSARQLQKRVGVGSTAGRRQFLQFTSIEALLMALAVGVGVALSQTPYPRLGTDFPTAAESLLGMPFPEPPTAARILFGWQTEPLFLGLGIVGIGLYVAGVVRLQRRGDSWPVLRTVAWISGWLLVIWATNAGVAIYSMVSLSWHMVGHMTLAMTAPILLAMSAPMSLALRALPTSRSGRRGAREWIVWVMHSPYGRFITHPLVVLFIFTFGLYGLYYTPLFGTLMATHLGHVFMEIHFLVSGFLFAWVAIQTDPLPRSLPPAGRFVMVLVAMVLHSFFAVPIMMTEAAFGSNWYARVQPPWLPDLIADSQMAGGIAWGLAELPTFILVIAVAVQWARSDDREAKRQDRQADRDGNAALAAYNANLRQLHDRDVEAEQRSRR